MKNDKSFFEENFIIAIDRDGKFFSVPKVEGEINHYQPYRRLNQVLNGIIGDIPEGDSSLNLPNTVAKLGFINIVPPELEETIDDITTIFLVFPFDPTEEQLNTLENLYDNLEKIQNIYYFEKPSEKTRLNFSVIKPGMDNLKLFVKEKLDKIRDRAESTEREMLWT